MKNLRKDYEPTLADQNNTSNQGNPNNDAYWSSRD